MVGVSGEGGLRGKRRIAARREIVVGISLLFRFVLWSCIRIRAKETFAVEMDHVIRVFGNPHLGFPGDVR